MSAPDWSELRRLAEEATPGRLRWGATDKQSHEEMADYIRDHFEGHASTRINWVLAMEHPGTVLGADEDRPEFAVCVAETGNGPNSENNARFIAAASRDVILALLDRAEKAEAERDRLREALGQKFDAIQTMTTFRLARERDRLRDALEWVESNGLLGSDCLACDGDVDAHDPECVIGVALGRPECGGAQ